MLMLIMSSTFLSVFLVLYSIFKFYFDKHDSILRLKKYLNADEITEIKRKSRHKDFMLGSNFISKGIENIKFLDGYKKQIQVKLASAHILLKAEEYITICLILFILLGIMMFLISGNIFAATIGALTGWAMPGLFIKSKRKRRLKELNSQLSEAIILISNSLKAGYSFFQSVDIVAREMTGPIAQEFSAMLREINLGLTTEKALENLVNRVKSDDLELIVTAVLIQRQVGGNLSEVLDSISSTIRERIKIKGEIKTVTAQGRVSGLVISLLPPVLGLIIFLINPEHISLLFNTAIGLGMLTFSVVMELIGICFVKKIINIEV